MFRQRGWRLFPVNRAAVWLQSDDHALPGPNLVRCTQGWALKRRQAVIFLVRLMGYFSPLQSITLPSAAGSLFQRLVPLPGTGDGQMLTREPHSAAEYTTSRTWTPFLFFFTSSSLPPSLPPLTLFSFVLAHNRLHTRAQICKLDFAWNGGIN